MRVAIVVAAALLLFACERGVNSPQPYGVGSNYGGPGHSYASSAGGSTFAVVPLDLLEMSGLPDAEAADGGTETGGFDLGFEATAKTDECLETYAGWGGYCTCKFNPDEPELAEVENYCTCKYLVCMEGEPHSSIVDPSLATGLCPPILDFWNDGDTGTCPL